MTNRRVQNILAAVVILLAFVALIFQERIEDWLQEFKSDPRPAIASIESLSNNVKYRLPESLTYNRAKSGMELHAKDTVSTDATSTAIIVFKTGLKVELEPNSLMIVEDYGKEGSNLELTFLRGNVKILNQAKGIKLSGLELNKTQAQKDAAPALKLDLGFLTNAEAPAPNLVAPALTLEEKKEKVKEKPVPKFIVEKETLPDSYIASVIKNQRTFLNRCYAQRLRLNPDARGRIDTSLTIEPDGSISTARVIGSTISDPTLQQCVVSTLQRARFKTFNGDPIIVQYPINFE